MNDSMAVSPTSKSPPCELGDARACLEHGAEAAPSSGAGRLAGHIERVAELASNTREEMYQILARYFANVTRGAFERDLEEKEWVILLADARSGRIQGFSTLLRLRTTVGNQPVVAFFSGDTIIAREYWGETLLSRLWAQHVFGLAVAVQDARAYWFLISSGYKTYRFLSTFFRDFYPRYERPTPPAVKQVLDVLASRKFPSEYDPARGVVRLAHATPLRPGVAEITDQRLRDPHVAFFVAANPGHADGDELACLTELTMDNLTPAGRRMVLGSSTGER